MRFLHARSAVLNAIPALCVGRRPGLDGALVLGFIGSFFYTCDGLEMLLRALRQVLAQVANARFQHVYDSVMRGAAQ